MGCISALLTAFYSIRLIYLTFITNTNSKKEIYIGAHEPSFYIILPLLLLAFGSIFVGYMGKEAIISNVIPPIVSNFVKVVPLNLSILGALLAFLGYNGNLKLVNNRIDLMKVRHMVYTFFNSA